MGGRTNASFLFFFGLSQDEAQGEREGEGRDGGEQVGRREVGHLWYKASYVISG